MRYVAVLVVGVLAGLSAGVAIGLFVYPYIFLADIVADEKIEDVDQRMLIARGTFIHANPSDPIHWGKGNVSVYRDLVRLEADFAVGPGPKYHVYLVPQKGITPSTAIDATMFIDLGRLRAFQGSQNYSIPDGVELADYPSVVIWCEQFSVLISPAELRNVEK